MNSLQMAAPRLVTLAARSVSTAARRQVSMKEAFSAGTNKGVVPTSAGYQRIRALQNEFNAAARILPRVAARRVSTSTRSQVSMKENFSEAKNRGVVPSSDGYRKIRALQNEFNSTPEKMVWQKRGLRDLVPLQLTYGLMFVGLAIAAKNLWDMSWPQSPN